MLLLRKERPGEGPRQELGIDGMAFVQEETMKIAVVKTAFVAALMIAGAASIGTPQAGTHPQGAAKDFSACYFVYGTARDLCLIAVDAGCGLNTGGEPSAFCRQIEADYIELTGADIAWSEDMKEDLKFQCGVTIVYAPLPSAYTSVAVGAIDSRARSGLGN